MEVVFTKKKWMKLLSKLISNLKQLPYEHEFMGLHLMIKIQDQQIARKGPCQNIQPFS